MRLISTFSAKPLLLSVCQRIEEGSGLRRTKARSWEYRMNAAGRKMPLRQDLGEAPRGKIVGNRKIREHREPCALAHGELPALALQGQVKPLPEDRLAGAVCMEPGRGSAPSPG